MTGARPAADRAARRSGRRARMLVGAVLLAATLAGCAGYLEPAPTPTPLPFPGIVGMLGRYGVEAVTWTSGDPGCDDPTLSPTAIRFEARGLDQPDPVNLRIYIFRDRAAWQRRLADVDSCAAAWAEDPESFELFQVSPYVLAGQGPWPPEFDVAVRTALTEAAGTGD